MICNIMHRLWFSFQAVFAYIGSRPSQELVDRYLKILSEMASGHLVDFLYVRI